MTNTPQAGSGVTEPAPLQGLAAYLRCEAGGVFEGHPSHATLLQWATEVDAAQSRQPIAEGAAPDMYEINGIGYLPENLPMGVTKEQCAPLYRAPANMAVGAGGSVGAVEKHEWLQESSYRAGAKAGFNLGIAENHEGLHALLAAHQYPRPTPEQATTGSGQGVTDAERYQWRMKLVDAIREHGKTVYAESWKSDHARSEFVRKKLDNIIDAVLPGTVEPRLSFLSTASPAGAGEGKP